MRARMTAGIVAGVVLAVAGPTFIAVGTHSGNLSGSDPVSVDLDVSLERTARATWAPAGGVTRYHLEVVERTEVTARAGTLDQSAARSVGGEAVARTELCNQDGCIPGTTWRASLGSPITEGAWLRGDPLLQGARFRGWLRIDGTGPACLFVVDWDAGAAQPTVEPSAEGTVEPPEQVSVLEPTNVPAASTADELRLETERDATGRVTASCWSAGATGDFAGGAGELTQDIVAIAAAEEQSVSTEHVLD